MKIKTDSVLPIPSDRRIRWFEESYRVTLPKDYKQFIKESNGAVPETNVFEYAGHEYLVERFLCLLDKPREENVYGWYDLTSVLTQLDERLIDDEDLIGMNIIPIAALFAGDFVCLDFRNIENPSIVIWLHEESDELSPVTKKVAENFTEFLNMLKE